MVERSNLHFLSLPKTSWLYQADGNGNGGTKLPHQTQSFISWSQFCHEITRNEWNEYLFFSCPADSPIGDLVTDWLTEWVSDVLILEHKTSHWLESMTSHWLEQDIGTFWGLSEDFLRTFWGLSEDFPRTFCGLFEDFLRTFWGLF